jgi:hypothetical protein
VSLMMLAERAVAAFERFARAHEAIAEAVRSGQVPLPSGPVVSAGVQYNVLHAAAGKNPWSDVAGQDKLGGAGSDTRAQSSMPHGAPYAEKPAAEKPRKLTHEDARKGLLAAAQAWPRDAPDSKQANAWASKQLGFIVMGHGGPGTTKVTEVKEEFIPAVVRAASALEALGRFAVREGVPAAMELLAKHAEGATDFSKVTAAHVGALLDAAG